MLIKHRKSFRQLFLRILFCGALRLIFFALTNTYKANLHQICNIHRFIKFDMNKSMLHIFIITLSVMSVCFININLILFSKRLNKETFSITNVPILLTNDMKHFLGRIIYLFIINYDIAMIIVGLFISLTIILSVVYIRKSGVIKIDIKYN